MATNEVKETKETATNEKGKGLTKIAEVKMLLYIIPVAIILFLAAFLLRAR